MASSSNSVGPQHHEVPVSAWLPPVLLAWFIPGSGHFLLKKHARGGLLALAVVAMFLFGIMMQGATFQKAYFDLSEMNPRPDLLTRVITIGGFVGNLASGILYMMTAWFGYDQADVAGHVHDYGTKFLVAAGLLNILAIVDVFEIATKRKD